MKRKFTSTLALIATCFFFYSMQTGCKKETVVQQPASLSKDSILVQKTWRVDQVYSLIDGTLAKYTRGGTNTTGINFDNQRYKFNPGGTGTYTNPTGNTYNLTWAFTTADKRTLSFNVPALNSFSTWEMVEIADNYFHFTVNAPVAVTNLSSYRLVQVP